MGYRVSWIARLGTSTKELLDFAQRTVTGERHEFPDVGWYLLELPHVVGSAWVLLIADGSENYGDLDPSDAEALSKDGNETLYFCCSDTVMATYLMCYKDGAQVWAIEYDCKDQSEPAFKGKVPSIAHQILNELRAEQQAECDFGADYQYDLTAELGRRLVGFRHDVDLEIEDPEPFQVLGASIRPHPRWQFWKR